MNLPKIIDDIKNIDFNNIQLEDIGDWPVALKVISCLFCFIVTISLGNFFYLNLTTEKYDIAIKKEQQLKNEYKIKHFQSANLDEVKKHIDAIKIDLNKIIDQLPQDAEVPNLLEDISNAAKTSGLHIDSIKLQKENSEFYYISLPINISVKGNYHQLGKFISKISNLTRVVNLGDFEITKSDNDNLLTMNIVAQTYRYQRKEAY